MVDFSTLLADQEVAIFLFHGVIRENRHQVRNYTAKHVLVDRFAAILDDLCGAGTPVSMPDVLKAIRGDIDLPPRAFVVTFDDGFENNRSVAAPMLADKRIPAMFYVTTGFVDQQGCSWIDLIEYAFESAGPIDLDCRQPRISGRCATPAEKRRLLDDIRRIVKAQPDVDPYDLAQDVWAQLEISTMDPDAALDRKMTWSQLRELAQDPLFTVGGHSHTHRIMAYLSDPDLEQEIDTSLSLLRHHLGAEVEHYSYPEGMANCYSDRVIAALRRRGIVCAPTAEPGMNRLRGADPFRLKRIMVT